MLKSQTRAISTIWSVLFSQTGATALKSNFKSPISKLWEDFEDKDQKVPVKYTVWINGSFKDILGSLVV